MRTGQHASILRTVVIVAYAGKVSKVRDVAETSTIVNPCRVSTVGDASTVSTGSVANAPPVSPVRIAESTSTNVPAIHAWAAQHASTVSPAIPAPVRPVEPEVTAKYEQLVESAVSPRPGTTTATFASAETAKINAATFGAVRAIV